MGYAVGGIALAFLARGLVALAGQWPQAAARERYQRAARLIGWIPSRLLSCTFGLAGDLAGWSREIRKVFPGFGKEKTKKKRTLKKKKRDQKKKKKKKKKKS